MKKKFLSKKMFWLLVFLIYMFLVTYFFFFMGRIHFKEEVRLANGKIIVIERKIETSSYGEIGGPGGWDMVSNSLELIEQTSTKTQLVWETDRRLSPVLLDWDEDSQEWYLILVFRTCKEFFDHGRPEYAYVEQRYRDGQWREVPIAYSRFGRKANLFSAIRTDDSGLIDLKTKEQRMSEVGIDPGYVHILSKYSLCD